MGTAAAMAMTLGVEEEYLLLDAVGVPAARSTAVLSAAGRQPRKRAAELQHELLEVQVEVATPVCTELGEVEEQLAGLRTVLARAARAHDCRLAPIGAAPLAPGDDRVVVTDKPRYQDMLRQAPALVEEQLINGMHVHVGVPDRGAGVQVLAGVRAWLPVVLALSANSPWWRGRDSGFASFRAVHFARWPVEGPTPVFASAEDYESRAETLLATGAIRDRGQLYWHARLSEHVPTVEVRVADVQLEPESAVVLAGIIRALAATALASAPPAPAGQVPVEVLRAATWAAARHGLDADLVDPFSCRARPAADVVPRLLDHVRAALDEAGDSERVEPHVARLLAGGNGATRQRVALREKGLDGLLDLVTL
jgi:glutamate---cysteine ligase / carboxylate-amine ligase